MSYTTWEQYRSLYNDIKDEAEFNALEKFAETKINALTHMQVKNFLKSLDIANMTDFEEQCKTQIELTTMEVVHRMKHNSTSDAGQGIASVSNEGYSVTYTNTTAKSVAQEIEHIILGGLAGTGLQGVM